MKVYQYLSEIGDRRSEEFKAISKHYESMCIKDGSRFMETKEAKVFANLDIEEAKKLLSI